jgi:integrase
MTKSNSIKPLNELYEMYLQDTSKGRRLQRNGKLVSKSTLSNYKALYVNLKRMENDNEEKTLINVNYRYSKRAFEVEKRKYKKFYKKFTDYLYSKGCTDNYVGMMIKQLRSFFIYLNQSKGYNTGQFYKEFYVRKEEIPVVVLSMERLQYLINDSLFSNSLPNHLQTSKDIFVFGCTVGLRFSDIISLKNKNRLTENGHVYLVTKSQKTGTHTRIKLPAYAIDILNKYRHTSRNLLPAISLNQFNKNLKIIGELACWTEEIGKERSKRGVRKEIRNTKGKIFRFCDSMSSHMMRRTAITTLLINGMPEPLVRKISGHAAGSKEFYKYVQYSESFVDLETDRVFERMMNRTNN